MVISNEARWLSDSSVALHDFFCVCFCYLSFHGLSNFLFCDALLFANRQFHAWKVPTDVENLWINLTHLKKMWHITVRRVHELIYLSFMTDIKIMNSKYKSVWHTEFNSPCIKSESSDLTQRRNIFQFLLFLMCLTRCLWLKLKIFLLIIKKKKKKKVAPGKIEFFPYLHYLDEMRTSDVPI